MKIKTKMITTVALFAAAVATPLVMSAGAASASTSGLNYEVDDGVSWSLSASPSNLSAPVQSTYADAGVVADIGQASSFNGISFTGSGPLADNIWIGNGAEAYTPGTHLLSDGADFSYGFDNGNGTFYMASGTHAGQTLTVSDINTDFAGSEAYAWVGVVYTGTNVSGTVTSINGQNTSHRSTNVTLKAGTLTATVK
jgi:hypothetical protein